MTVERSGKIRGIPAVQIYGYAFDTRVTDPAVWEQFYRAIISGVEKKLDERVVFHWTNNGSSQQMYGFQHFPEIQSYIFNEANSQTPVNSHCVTFVVHYDDLGVSFARGGPRAVRWIRNDVRYLQESLWLAKHTDPDLVFNSVSRDRLTSPTDTAAMVIAEEPLPLNRIRLVAPPELDQSLAQTLPVGFEKMKLRVIVGQRGHIPFPDADSQPPRLHCCQVKSLSLSTRASERPITAS